MARSAAKVDMRKIREILRLKLGQPKRTNREIGLACRVSPSTVSDTHLRFKASGLAWPLPEDLDDGRLEAAMYSLESRRLFPGSVVPVWSDVHLELRQKNSTLALLWHEYKRDQGENGYGYSWYCEQYRLWARQIKVSMRQTHVFGQKCFVDFAGQTMPVVDSESGVIRSASIFVAVLGGSNYTFAEATWAQDTAGWLRGQVDMFEFFGGVTEIVVPDNPKAAVKRPDYYDPELNVSYQEWAEHYGVAVIPARVRRPKDKAKVEVAVQLVQRWILFALRKRTFYSIDELNEAIDELLTLLNRRPFKKLPGTREKMFLDHEKATLRPLPAERYEFGQWLGPVKVAFDYHVQADGRLYSVHYTFADKPVRLRLTYGIVEVFHENQRIASHKRQYGIGPAVTLPEHMPSNHKAYAKWTPARISSWATEMGSSVRELCEGIMARRAHPEQGFRACLGVLQLAKKHGKEELEKACDRAVRIKAFRWKSVQSILQQNLQRKPLSGSRKSTLTIAHENVRGSDYYAETEENHSAIAANN